MDYGIICLLPPVLTIVLAFLTKQVVLSLLAGVFTGALILNSGNPVHAFTDMLELYLTGSLADTSHAAIIIFTMTLGGMVSLITAMGGLQAIVRSMRKKVKTPVGTQIVTAILGIMVFFDDLANIMVVGPTMRPMSDSMMVSREKQAYLVHTTAGVVAGICVITTWGGFEIGLVNDAFTEAGVSVSAFWMIIKAIPFMFYNILAIVLMFFIAGMGRDFGPMLKAERRARTEHKLYADDAVISNKDEDEVVEATSMAYALIPIIVLVGTIIVGLVYQGYRALEGNVNVWSGEGLRLCLGEADPMPAIVWAAVLSTLVAAVIAKLKLKFTIPYIYQTWVKGFVSLAEMMLILVSSWAVGSIVGELGTATYLVNIATNHIPGALLPAIIFLIACVISFSTGTSWGTMPIVFPLAVPMAIAYVDDPTSSALVAATIAAVLSGSIFGDQTSPISDSTVLTSASVGCDILHHVKTQAPYEVGPAILAFLGFLIVGICGLSPFLFLAIGIAVIIVYVRLIGKDPARLWEKKTEEGGTEA